MVRYKNETPITSEEIQAQAESLARIAERYKQCAELLNARQIAATITTHWASAKGGMEAITRHSSELLFAVENRMRRIAADDSGDDDKKPPKGQSKNAANLRTKAQETIKKETQGKKKPV